MLNMENIAGAKQIINDSKNIYLIPSQEPEAIAAILALFYTLKNLGKNVNLVLEALPDNLKFLAPSLDFISYPKNFVISVPNNVAQISQIYYEKNPDALKIHLTLEGGNIKKDNISFYFSETKPDLVITLGVKDYQKELSNKLDSFGFLLDSPVLNIDTSTSSVQTNKKFGKINLVESISLTEIASAIIKEVSNGLMAKESARCLLSGLVAYTKNFRENLTADIFSITSELIRKGVELKEITDNIK